VQSTSFRTFTLEPKLPPELPFCTLVSQLHHLRAHLTSRKHPRHRLCRFDRCWYLRARRCSRHGRLAMALHHSGSCHWSSRSLCMAIPVSQTSLYVRKRLTFRPDTPLTTKWLNEEEKQLAHTRLLRDRVDVQEKGSTWQGLKQAVRDPRVWLFCLTQNLHLVSSFCTTREPGLMVSPPTVSRTSSHLWSRH